MPAGLQKPEPPGTNLESSGEVVLWRLSAYILEKHPVTNWTRSLMHVSLGMSLVIVFGNRPNPQVLAAETSATPAGEFVPAPDPAGLLVWRGSALNAGRHLPVRMFLFPPPPPPTPMMGMGGAGLAPPPGPPPGMGGWPPLGMGGGPPPPRPPGEFRLGNRLFFVRPTGATVVPPGEADGQTNGDANGGIEPAPSRLQTLAADVVQAPRPGPSRGGQSDLGQGPPPAMGWLRIRFEAPASGEGGARVFGTLRLHDPVSGVDTDFTLEGNVLPPPRIPNPTGDEGSDPVRGTGGRVLENDPRRVSGIHDSF